MLENNKKEIPSMANPRYGSFPQNIFIKPIKEKRMPKRSEIYLIMDIKNYVYISF